jgi:hypothetical protein
MCQTLIGKIIREKQRAETKYPSFASDFLRPVINLGIRLDYIKTELDKTRALSDRQKPNYTIDVTLYEEVMEVMEAAGEERWEDCMDELAQVGSVVLRAMEWVQKHKLNKETNNA